MGWRRGNLAAGMVRDAVPHYCLGECSALLVFVRRSRQVRMAGPRRLPSVLSLPRVPRGACGEMPRPDVPCPCPLVRQSMWSVRSACSVQ